MQWYYLDINRQQIPFDENYLQALVTEGTVRADTLVWNQSYGSDWKPANNAFPAWFPSAQPNAVVETGTTKRVNEDLRELVRDLASYISANAGWIKFFGVMIIIGGVLSIPIGALYIWLGIILLRAAEKAKMAERSGAVESLEESLYELGRFFKINGIVVIVMLVLYVVMIILFIVFGGAMIAAAAANFESQLPDQL